MKKTLTVLLALAGASLAQPNPPSIGRLYDGPIRSAESEIVGLVEAMPADKFGFAPTQGEFKGVRTFAQQAKHLSAVIFLVAAAAAEEKPPIELGKDQEAGPDSVQSKDQIVKFMQDAFAYAHKVFAPMTADNELKMVKSPFGQGQTARGSLASIAVYHSFDHYGQMVVYARMNGIIPPASR